MQCESCGTEFTGEACPTCGLKVQRVMCRDCFKKFYKPYLKDGLCPECYELEVNAPYKNPYIALGLSIIPGLGHNYLGLKNKAGVYLLLFGFSIIIPIIGWILLLPAFFWPMIDAYKTAQRMNMRG